MKLTVLTSDAAQADGSGKVNALGMGWSMVGTPLPAHAVIMLFHIDWHESNEKHTFVLELLDEDGNAVSIGNENGAALVRVEGQFEQGRPPGIVKGTPLVQPVVIQLPPGMPLPGGKRYEYRVTVGDKEGVAAFAVLAP